jgi:hypothetical protein
VKAILTRVTLFSDRKSGCGLFLGVFHRDGFFTMQHSLEKRARQPESDDFLRLPAID